MSKAKILISDYKTALINHNIVKNELFINEIIKIAHKIKRANFWNWYYWIPLFKDTENEIIKKLSTGKMEYYKQLLTIDSMIIEWDYVDNDKFKNILESLELIKDDFIEVDLETVEFVNKYIKCPIK